MTERSFGRTVVQALVRQKELSILIATIAVAIYFSVTTTGFNLSDNYITIIHYLAPWAIVGAGEVMLLICGEIDLSAGFMFTLSPFVLMSFYNGGTPLILALILALVVCAAIGAANGFISTRFGIASFIVTLGSSFLLEGISLLMSNGAPVAAPASGWVVSAFGKAHWSELLWVLGVVMVMQILLSATRFGISTQATGGNPVGAAEAGIRVNLVKVVNFAIVSTLAGLGGIIDGLRLGSFDPTNGGPNTMFLAVASAVIGGTALLGGRGTVVGALLGALLLGIVFDGFSLAGVSANTFDVVLGVAIVIAMLLNVYLGHLRKRVSRT
ncbi:ABC transporter permease [Nocardia vaccinii]|uniref:ABC transporter permease n=1 Tax=Nocardia vaccinii TaxID=1822 RepID=UPI0008367A44|nr:ABC transporter permease [Nocardia vaccinii]